MKANPIYHCFTHNRRANALCYDRFLLGFRKPLTQSKACELAGPFASECIYQRWLVKLECLQTEDAYKADLVKIGEELPKGRRC